MYYGKATMADNFNVIDGLICRPIAEVFEPKSLYEAVFQPSVMRELSGGFGSYIWKKCASFSSESLEKYATLSSSYPLTEFKETIDYSYAIMSRFDYASQLAFYSATYRLCHLTTMAIQHKIEQTDWQLGSKFWISSAVSVLPLAVIFLLGGASSEIFIASMTKIVASYILPPVYSNLVKELDLIVKTRQFNIKGFLGQNTITAIRNLATTIVVIDFFLGLILPVKDPTESVQFLSNTLSFHLCMSLTDPTPTVVGIDKGKPTLLSYFIDECGWIVGKVAVDGVFILLNRVGLVKDLRDPINSIFSSSPFAQDTPAARRKIKKPTPTHRPAYAPIQYTALAPDLSAVVPDVDYDANAAIAPSSNRQAPIASRKIKRRHNTDPAPTTFAAPPAKTLTPTDIKIPNYPRKLVFLQGQGVQNIPNAWGVITYGIRDKEKQDLDPYITGLKTGHVGTANSKGVIKYLGKSKKTRQLIYSIRPANQEMRLLGTLIQGEETVYQVLKAAFGYERALALINKMKIDNGEIHLIDFNLLVRHQQINEYIVG
jgi:hypothetical protein